MTTLSPKIVKKLIEEFSVSERTIRNSISSLSKDYPHTTSNARAHLYAQKHGLNIYKFLSKEDKQTLPSSSGSIFVKQTYSKPKKANKKTELLVKRGFVGRAIGKIKGILNPQTFYGAVIDAVIAGVILFFLINRFSNNPRTSIDVTPTPTTFVVNIPSPSLTPEPKDSLKGNELILINEGSSFTDPVSGITIGVNWVLSRSYSELTVTFPGKSSEEFNNVKSGKRFDYVGKDRVNYVLTIVEIESNSIKARIDRNPA